MQLIHNRFERVVIEKIEAEGVKWPVLKSNPGLMEDAACIALNSLRPHYIRHSVDLSFYMSEAKIAEEERDIDAAVKSAIAFVLRGEQVKSTA